MLNLVCNAAHLRQACIIIAVIAFAEPVSVIYSVSPASISAKRIIAAFSAVITDTFRFLNKAEFFPFFLHSTSSFPSERFCGMGVPLRAAPFFLGTKKDTVWRISKRCLSFSDSAKESFCPRETSPPQAQSCTVQIPCSTACTPEFRRARQALVWKRVKRRQVFRLIAAGPPAYVRLPGNLPVADFVSAHTFAKHGNGLVQD